MLLSWPYEYSLLLHDIERSRAKKRERRSTYESSYFDNLFVTERLPQLQR
jgi:hypothetical protein